MNDQKSGTNVVLMAVVGLLVGFIGGYFIGQHSAQQSAALANTAAVGAANGVVCPHQLDAKDQWIIAGFRCPNTDTAQVALLGCHCPVAHNIEDLVKAQLASGKTGQQVRDQLMMEYGDRLKFRGQ